MESAPKETVDTLGNQSFKLWEASTFRTASTLLPVYISENGEPASDLDYEEYLLTDHSHPKPCLFTFHWSNPVLVIGRGQTTHDINQRFCLQEGIPIIRRRTGGRAVLHHQSLNIALVLPARHPWARQINGLYQHFVTHVGDALRNLGVAVTVPGNRRPSVPGSSHICFESDFGETLLFEHRKVFGCAQRRLRHSILVHGTLLLAIDVALQSRVFNVPESRITRAMSHIPGNIDPQMARDAIIHSFSSGLESEPVRKGGYHDR